jgi:hypothetical protein
MKLSNSRKALMLGALLIVTLAAGCGRTRMVEQPLWIQYWLRRSLSLQWRLPALIRIYGKLPKPILL